MAVPIKVLCVHGVGMHPPSGHWEGEWSNAIESSIKKIDELAVADIQFVHYDDLFQKHPITFLGVVEALVKLGWSGLTSGFSGTRRSAQKSAPGARLKWTAGMVVKWVEDEEFRKEARDRLRGKIEEFGPDIICGHSLGSLICYDTFASTGGEDLSRGRVFMSFGSQLANAFVRGNFPNGRLTELPALRFWFHLFNPHDDVFTAELRMHGHNFAQLETVFNDEGWADHSAISYLSHANAVERAWAEIVLARTKSAAFALQPIDIHDTSSPRAKRAAKAARTPRRRALLVGINEYPDPAMQLEGCVNDVFLVSAILQELGFEAGEVRVVLNERATTKAIQNRLDWLLDGVQSGDSRVFYFSGHGAQIPGYGIGEVVDHQDEALVPWDFDWSREKAIVDDDLYEMYVQLPYETDLTMIFDCCHSGGLTRQGGVKARGINPPDDIRHRGLCWGGTSGSWEPRSLDLTTVFDEPKPLNKTDGPIPINATLSTHRLGRATTVRSARLAKANPVKKPKESSGAGLYMPNLWYACEESQFAYEYRHGSNSYGAFTWSFVRLFREIRRAGGRPNPKKMADLLIKSVARINPNQRPQFFVPSAKQSIPLPWFGSNQ